VAVLLRLAETHGRVCFVVPFDANRREAFAPLDRMVERLQEATGAASEQLPACPPGGETLSVVRSVIFSPERTPVEADGSLRFLSSSGPAQMVESIARELRRLRSRDPDLRWRDCAVVFRSLSPYRGLIQEIMPRFGIPFDLPTGTPWVEIRALSYVRDLLQLRSNGFEKRSLLACLESTYCPARIDACDLRRLSVALPEHAPPEAVSRQLSGLAAAKERQLEEPGEEDEPSPTVRQRIARLRAAAEAVLCLEAVAAMPDRAGLADYAEDADRVIGTVLRIPELDGTGDLPPDAGLISWDRRALAELVARLRAMGRTWPHELPIQSFLDLLDLVLRDEVLRDSFPRTDAVPFHDPMAIGGLSFRVVFIAGLEEKAFPLMTRPGPFLGDEERRAVVAAAGEGAWMGTHADRAAGERLLFLSTLQAATDRAYLVYSESEADGRPTVLSPFVDEVRERVDLRENPAGRSVRRTTTADVLPRTSDDLWHPEEATAWALFNAYHGDGVTADSAPLLRRVLGGEPAIRGLRPELIRWYSGRITAYDGDLGDEGLLAEAVRQVWAGRPLSPTRLDSFGKCPWQFFAAGVLGLEAPETEEVEISPLERGLLHHRILERFYRSRWDGRAGRSQPPTEADEQEALEAIWAILEAECARFEAEGRVGHPGAWPHERQRLMARLTWFVRSEIEYFKKNPGQAPVSLEFRFGMGAPGDGTPGGSGEPLTIDHGGIAIHARGIVDRVDADPDGRAIVIDYKTGSRAPALKQVRDGTSFQLFVYLLAAEQLLGVDPEGGHYLMVAGPPGKKGGLTQSGRLVREGKPSRGQPEWPELRQFMLDHMSAYVRDIVDGRFPLLPTSTDPGGDPCRYCDYRGMCRVDEVRMAEGMSEDAARFARTRVRSASHE
jgi:RecB family exonuclease